LGGLSKRKLDKFLLDNEQMINVTAKIQKKTENRKLGAKKAKITKFMNKIKKVHKKPAPSFEKFIEMFETLKPKKKIKHAIIIAPEVNLHLKSVQQLKKFHGVVYNYTAPDDPQIAVVKETLSAVSKGIHVALTNVNDKSKKDYPQGFKINCKVHFVFYVDDIDKNGKKIRRPVIISTVFNGYPSKEIIADQIHDKIISQYHGDASSAECTFLHDVTFFVVGLEDKGGCASCKKVEKKLKYKKRTIQLISPKSSNDNRLFMCFISHLKKIR
jgi:hypothetical protein